MKNRKSNSDASLKKAPSWTFVILISLFLSYIAMVNCFLSKRICC